MRHEISLSSSQTILIAVSCLILTGLVFFAGWATAILARPSRPGVTQVAAPAPRPKPEPRQDLTAEAEAKMTARLTAMAPAGSTDSDAGPAGWAGNRLVVLSGGQWRIPQPEGVLWVPYAETDPEMLSGQTFFMITGVHEERPEARRITEPPWERDTAPRQVLEAVDGEGRRWYLERLGRYDDLTSARKAAQDYRDRRDAPAVVAYADWEPSSKPEEPSAKPEPTPESEPEPEAEPPSRTVYLVQVASFTEPDPALRMAEALRKEGYPETEAIRMYDSRNPEKVWYVVHIGQYMERSAARGAAAAFERKERGDTLIRQMDSRELENRFLRP